MWVVVGVAPEVQVWRLQVAGWGCISLVRMAAGGWPGSLKLGLGPLGDLVCAFGEVLVDSGHAG